MNAAPSMALKTPRQPTAGQSSQSLPVPSKWRTGQMVLIAVIALLAIYYYLVGWRGGTVPTREDSRGPMDFVGFGLLAALVWMTTPNAGVIATTTLQEAIRRRWLAVLLGFSLLFLLCLPFTAASFQPGEEDRFMQDYGIGFILTMTLLMSIFLGAALVPPDIERRTIFTILSKPVNRNEFVLGKFLGLCATLGLVLLSMSAVFLASFAFFILRRDGYAGAMRVDEIHASLSFTLLNLVNALILHFGQLCVMASLAILLSLMVSQITAIVFCFLAYFGGQMSSYWQNLGSDSRSEGSAPTLSRPMQNMVKIIYFALPRLDRFDVRTQLLNDSPIGFNYVWKSWNAGLIYATVLIVIAALVFSDREF